MTLITFQDGKPVLRDGKVGVGEACCCGGCHRCIRDGEWDCQYTTRESCEECEYACLERLQTECNGECPEGATPATITPSLEVHGSSPQQYATGSLTVGCGVILSAAVTFSEPSFASVAKTAPTLTLPGNATGTVSTQPQGDGTYAVSEVTVTDGGSGYADGEFLIFDTAADDVTVFSATAIARVAYTEPQNATVSVSSTGGSGAVFSLAWQLMPTPPQSQPNVTHYRPIITITDGGTGYADYDQIFISFSSPEDGGEAEYVYIDADIVGPNGEIEQIYMDPTDGGLYYGAATDALESVELGQGGSYYGVDKNAPPIVSAATVTVTNGGGGTGADITANIDTDPDSPTFGQVTSFTVTDGGSGYVSLCERTRRVTDCAECPERVSPEFSSCATDSESGPCGDWQGGFSDCDPPCCDSCLVRPNPPWPPSPTRTCVPTLNVEENTSDYIKTSSVSGPPWDVLYGPVPWSEEWLAEYGACTLVWVEDYVEQTNATGTYCADWTFQQIHPDLIGTYVPPAGCYLLGTNLWCATYTRRFWFRMRLFLVDCRGRTMREVTDEALTAPVERTGCVVPSKYECSGGLCGNVPLCDVSTGNYCLGANPGFLNAQPTLECGE